MNWKTRFEMTDNSDYYYFFGFSLSEKSEREVSVSAGSVELLHFTRHGRNERAKSILLIGRWRKKVESQAHLHPGRGEITPINPKTRKIQISKKKKKGELPRAGAEKQGWGSPLLTASEGGRGKAVKLNKYH
jgi:hypothetical protein